MILSRGDLFPIARLVGLVRGRPKASKGTRRARRETAGGGYWRQAADGGYYVDEQGDAHLEETRDIRTDDDPEAVKQGIEEGIREGRSAERARWEAVIQSPEAREHWAIAIAFLTNTGMRAAKIIEFLSVMPARRLSLSEKMQLANIPRVRPGGGDINLSSDAAIANGWARACASFMPEGTPPQQTTTVSANGRLETTIYRKEKPPPEHAPGAMHPEASPDATRITLPVDLSSVLRRVAPNNAVSR